MPASGHSEKLLNSNLVVHTVDPVNRELTVLSKKTRVVVYVPPDCPIRLRGERIKLRLLQPGDCVRVTTLETPNLLMALEIDVHSACPLPTPVRRLVRDRRS